MKNTYTETVLKKLNKEGLLKIAVDNGIEVPEEATKPKIIELILEKSCPVPSGDEGKPPADEADEGAQTFTKEDILKSNWHSHRREILAGLLDDDKTYSYAAVDKLVGAALKSDG